MICHFDGHGWYIRPHERLIPLEDGDWIVRRASGAFEVYPPVAFLKLFDACCVHGTAMDVHCCNCHSGFLFDAASCVCR